MAKVTATPEKQPKKTKVPGFHGLKLCTYIFDEVKNPKAVVVIIHGMQEHCLRYTHFAKFLNSKGYIVVTNDLRGHGRTAVDGKFGFGEKDIFAETVQDELKIIEYAHKTFNLPIYVFGHSYGSMITQKLVQESNLIEKAVICGTANGNSAVMKSGNALATIIAPFTKKDTKGGFLEKIGMSSYEKGFKDGNWLTRDEKVFEEYKKDKFCGMSFPLSFYLILIFPTTAFHKKSLLKIKTVLLFQILQVVLVNHILEE